MSDHIVMKYTDSSANSFMKSFMKFIEECGNQRIMDLKRLKRLLKDVFKRT